MQGFLASHLYFWNGMLRFHSNLYKEVQLGSDYRIDFAYYDKGSDGAEWHLVEIKAPHLPIFNKKGDPSRYLVRAMTEVREQQGWISRNHQSADRIMAGVFRPMGHIFIGRRSEISSRRIQERLKDLNTENRAHFKIATLDRFIDMADSVKWMAELPFPPRALTDFDLRHRFPIGELDWIKSGFGSRRDFAKGRSTKTVRNDELPHRHRRAQDIVVERAANQPLTETEPDR